MGHEVKDYYYSDKSFNVFKCGAGNENEFVGECLIEGKWHPFTEVITKGKEPHSTAWGDLKYVGASKQSRYTKATEWVEKRIK